MALAFSKTFPIAMRLERERLLFAGLYERIFERRGDENSQPMQIDTPAGTVTVQVPKTAGHEERTHLAPVPRARPSIGTGGRARGRRRNRCIGRLDPPGQGDAMPVQH